MEKIEIRPSMPLTTTELYIGENFLSKNFFERFCNHEKIVIVADHALKDLYATQLAKILHAELLIIPNGEKTKNKATQEYLENELCKMGANRNTLLIALGGGVTTDLVGFIASIYLRGVPLILIPTTLLAMVDAAIGGKNGVNTSFGKNLIGTIYHPKAIIADLGTLKTLPKKEWLNGLAEIFKMGLIFDASIWELAKNETSKELIFKAMKGKISIIEQDPKELGLRRILNFGHTIGHALETIASYEMSHGEAVAIGCLAEAHLSMRLGYLSESDFEQIQVVFGIFPLKLPVDYARQNLFQALFYDKKKAFGEMRFVLIDKIGHCLIFEGRYCRVVTKQELESTLDWMESFCG